MGKEQIKIEYIDHMGNDLSVVNSARVSFDKTSEFEIINFDEEEDCDKWFDEGGQGYFDSDYVYSDRWMGGYPVDVLHEKDKKLIKYLAKHRHTTPFRHNQIQIRCHAPIFLARQLGKHQSGLSWNEVSRRYVDSEPEFYTPDEWRGRPDGSIKQGSGELKCSNELVVTSYEIAMKSASNEYNTLLDLGVAPEMARLVLPQSMMTSWYWSGNLLAFAHVYKERVSPDAQLEAQWFAKQLDEVIRPLFPVAWSELVD